MESLKKWEFETDGDFGKPTLFYLIILHFSIN